MIGLLPFEILMGLIPLESTYSSIAVFLTSPHKYLRNGFATQILSYSFLCITYIQNEVFKNLIEKECMSVF